MHADLSIKRLLARLETLEAEVAALRRENQQLRRENQQLRRDNQQLRQDNEKIRRLPQEADTLKLSRRFDRRGAPTCIKARIYRRIPNHTRMHIQVW